MEALKKNLELSCKTLWISDVHLGSHHCKAGYLLELLKQVDCQHIYLVGDIIDVWAMHKRVYWPEVHNLVLRQLLTLSKQGVKITYIPGNHDANFRDFCGSNFGNVEIMRTAVHVTGKNKRLLVTHGDELDFAVRYSRINRVIGDFAYEAVMLANDWINKIRRRLGKPYWSLASWVKAHVSQAEAAVNAFQEAAVHLARQKELDGIICGHLHHPVIADYEGTLYCNDGDWVESCTALVEHANGELQLVRCLGHLDQDEPVLVREPALV